MHIPFAVDEIDYNGQSVGTLDFLPAKKISIKLKNANSISHAKDFVVTYSLPANQLIIKPLFLSGTLLIFALAVVVLSRAQL